MGLVDQSEGIARGVNRENTAEVHEHAMEPHKKQDDSEIHFHLKRMS